MKKLISLILAFCLITSLLPAYAADAAMTRDELVSNYEAVEQAVFTAAKSEYGYASSGNSSTLAWAASYMLESYAQMYRNTGEEKYLKSLGVQFREALSYLNYDYGEDKLDWDAPNYSISRMADPEFDNEFCAASSETSVSTAAWMRKFGSDADRVNVEAGVGVTDRGLHIISGGGKLQGAKIDIDEYAEGMIYQFSISAKNTAPARAYIVDSNGAILKNLDGNEYVVFDSPSSFKSYTVRYSIPVDSGTLSIHLESAETDTEGDIYFDTVSFRQAAQFLVHDMMMLAAGAKFVEAVYGDEALAATVFEDSKTYRDIADEFLPVMEKMIDKWDFCWREVGDDMGVYVWPMDDSSSYAGNTLPHNQYIKMACAMMPLYEVTGNAVYLDRAERMLRFFKSKIITVGEGDEAYCYWKYYDPAFTEKAQSSRVEDISHGCLELDAAIMGYERGIVFDEADMKKFANAFVKILWNGDLDSPVIYNYLTDDSTSSLYHKEITSPSNVRDWARLGRWNRDITAAIVNYLSANSPTSGHPTKMLAYSYSYPYIFNPLSRIAIETVSGSETQFEGNEQEVVLTITANSGVDETVLEQTVWTVKKDSDAEESLGTGSSVGYTPSGAGQYLITANLSGYSTSFEITVAKEMPGDVNSDGNVDINDAVRLFQYSMLPDMYPLTYTGNVDFIQDGNIDINDAVRLFQYSMLPDMYPIS